MDERLFTQLEELLDYRDADSHERAEMVRRAAWLSTAPIEECCELLLRMSDVSSDDLASADPLLHAIFSHLAQVRRRTRGEFSATWLQSQSPQVVVLLYMKLPPESKSRAPLLSLLAAGGTREELTRLVDRVTADPPRGENDVVTIFAPLFQFTDYDPDWLFPALLAALAQPSLAAGVLDLCNYLVRRGVVAVHPAAARARELTMLLGELTQRLQRLEERPEAYAASPQELSRTISHGVSLTVALCDALALIGDAVAKPKLSQTMELRHRRIRTEAAAALARLGETTGGDELIKLASEPIARLRVLSYAEELGLSEKIEPEYQTPTARAEGELAAWLSEPTQYGIPPSECELVESRTLYWPGFEDPVEAFLFRFTYRFPTEGGFSNYANIGIAGPMTNAIAADLADLPPDDIFALFAGRDAEHEEIFEVEAMLLSDAQRVEVSRLERRLRDDRFTEARPLLLCYFFGEKSLVARARRDGVEGIALVDSADTLWLPATHGPRSLGPQEALWLYRGRRMLRSFNP